jgi:predicted Rossmann fold flavoprotein
LEHFDLAVVGAGAAGMMCAAVAGQRGKSVVLIDHFSRPAEKIRISGGGRCNFTNTGTGPENFLSRDPEFCRTALAAYTPQDFIALVKRYRIGYHEKHRGQLFCDDSSESIIGLLRAECGLGGVELRSPLRVDSLSLDGGKFHLSTSGGPIASAKLVIATGGLSIPKIGASDFGYRIARQFRLPVVEPRPALVPLTFAPEVWRDFAPLAGLALPVSIATAGSAVGPGGRQFDEDLLFTHRGLSGPAVLQISSYWEHKEPLVVDLIPNQPVLKLLLQARDTSRQDLGNVLAQWLPRRLALGWLATQMPEGEALANRKIAEISNKSLDQISKYIKSWQIIPSGTEGFKKAEVTRGGVDTGHLAAHSMEALQQPGLFFIGEVVDVTGWLGGYNFQWAWASAVAAGRAI